jgi:hypothetical protein
MHLRDELKLKSCSKYMTLRLILRDLVFHFSVVIFFWSFGIIDASTIIVEKWVPLKPVLEGGRDVVRFHYPSCTDSIKPSLQLSWYFVVINVPRDHFVSSFFLEVMKRKHCLHLSPIMVDMYISFVKIYKQFIRLIILNNFRINDGIQPINED